MPTQPRRVASFVVYKDESSSTMAAHKPTPFGTRNANARITVSSANDKENLDPLTGLRPSSSEHSGKKRKTNALASKPVPLNTKPLSGSVTTKKRKLAAGSVIEEKKEKKEKRAGNAKKPSRIPRVRKATNLPRVDEAEEEAEDKRAEPSRLNENQLTQAEIDAKCYEFTVLPLADLSHAYDTSSPPESSLKIKVTEVNEVANTNVAPAKLSITESNTEETEHLSVPNSHGPPLFNTPERKRIYSAFTFESPSPASRRFASWRESSVPPLPAVNFFFDPSEEP